jgi:hypothetical protein
MSEEGPTYYRHGAAASDVDALLLSPSASSWLKDALRAALERDPVDAVNDAELLAAVLAKRYAALQRKG